MQSTFPDPVSFVIANFWRNRAMNPRPSNSPESEGEDNPDRLSELPEPLLIHILSGLEMVDAVKAGILSKHWKNLWTKVDSTVYKFNYLSCNGREESDRKFQEFISFVDRTLMQCTCPTIKKFSLSAGYRSWKDDESVRKLVDKWLSFALDKNVEFLKLDLEGMKFPVPDRLFHTSCLVNLEMRGVVVPIVPVLSNVSWSLLKSLSLYQVKLDDECLANVLLGCPVLETLILEDVVGISNLNIRSRSVKKVRVWYVEGQDVSIDEFLKIDAPWIQELEIVGGFIIFQLQLVNVSSLKKADIVSLRGRIDDEAGEPDSLWWNNMVDKVLRPLCHVDELIIGTEIVQVLTVSKLLGRAYPLLKCKHLTVRLPIWYYDLYGMACVLQNAPCLETLVIKVTDAQRAFLMRCTKDHFRNRDQDFSLPDGSLLQLKNVEVIYERQWCPPLCDWFDDNPACQDYELVKYILRNASILEKLVFSSSGDICAVCDTICSLQYMRHMSSNMLNHYLVWNDTFKWELRKKMAAHEFRFPRYTPLHPKDLGLFSHAL